MERKFTTRQTAVVEHYCKCGRWGCFGLTYPRVVVEIWFCPDHLPADFWKGSR